MDRVVLPRLGSIVRSAEQTYVQKRTGSLSYSSKVTQAEGKSRLSIHRRTRVVFPNPVGAITRLIFRIRPASRRTSNCSRGRTAEGRRGGISLVWSSLEVLGDGMDFILGTTNCCLSYNLTTIFRG